MGSSRRKKMKMKTFPLFLLLVLRCSRGDSTATTLTAVEKAVLQGPAAKRTSITKFPNTKKLLPSALVRTGSNLSFPY